MRAFLIALLLVLALQANLFVTLGVEHMAYTLCCSTILWVAIQIENKGVSFFVENYQTYKKQVPMIIPPVGANEIRGAHFTTLPSGVSS